MRKPLRNNDWKSQRKNYVYLLAAGTLKTATATDVFPENKLCRQFGVLAMTGRRVGRMSGLSAGTEWIYDGYAREIKVPAQFGGTGFAGSINGARLPWNFTTDLNIQKRIPITISSETKKKIMFNVYFRVQNLFNTKNVINLYRFSA